MEEDELQNFYKYNFSFFFELVEKEFVRDR